MYMERLSVATLGGTRPGPDGLIPPLVRWPRLRMC